MPTIEILRGATTYNISAGNPISLVDGDDLGGASVRNIEESGPYQDGSTHLDERLEPRTMTLRLNVIGTTAAALDGYRDTLNAMFKPVRGVPITVRYTRDDGAVRTIDTRRTGPLSTPLRPVDYAGKLYRAVVQLRAADPTWYDPTEEEVDYAFPQDTAWWTAGGSIPSANALVHVTSPSIAQAWGGATQITSGSAFTIVFRSGSVLPTATNKTAWGVSSEIYANVNNGGGSNTHVALEADFFWVDFAQTAGTYNIYTIFSGSTVTVYRGTVSVGATTPGVPDTFNTSTGRWRSRSVSDQTWDQAMPYAAFYDIALSAAQRAALNSVLDGTVPVIEYATEVVYDGDVDTYPIIELHGPISNPSITNDVTGDTLSFSRTPYMLGSAEILTIDLRYGRKSAVITSGSSVLNYLTDSSDLATFRIVPDPIATGGTNTFSLGGGSIGTATALTVRYFERYLSF